MAFQQREMSGSLFSNDRKEKETQPDFKGECLIDGITYEIGAWKKTGGSGREFTSLSFKIKSATYRTEQHQGQGYQNVNPTYEQGKRPDFTPPQAIDDLPF